MTKLLTAIVCLSIAGFIGTCLCGCTPKPAPDPAPAKPAPAQPADPAK